MSIFKIHFTILALVVFASLSQAQSASWAKFASAGFKDRYELTTSAVNGKIYAIGGGVPVSNLVQIYDPATDTWTTPQVQGQFTPHYGATAAMVNGKIFIFGGAEDQIDYADSVWIFDPSDNTWSSPSLSEGNNTPFTTRSEPASAVLGDSVFVIGGSQGFGLWVNTVEVYHITSRTWTTLNAIDSFNAQWTPSASVVGGKVYVIGHPFDTLCKCEVQVYDPKTNQWSIEPSNPMPVARTYFGSAVVNDKIYIIGGGDWYNGNFSITQTVEVYSPALHHWDTLVLQYDSTFHNRAQLAISAIDNKIYVMGGFQSEVNNVVLTLPESKVENGNEKIYSHCRVYPNPATNELNLISQESQSHFKVSDMLGRAVLSGMTADHGTLTLNIANFPGGVYNVLVERADLQGVFTEAGKIIKIDK